MNDERGSTAAPPRDAATLALVRRRSNAPGADALEILMGQRGGAARFMPNKVVFPGGAVDPSDLAIAAASPSPPLPGACQTRLMAAPGPDAPSPEALALAVVRETFEETGLLIGRPDDAAATSPAAASDDPSWRAIAAAGAAPSLDALRFIFRAITPPGLPIRFDARFFVADVSAVLGDPNDMSGASGELAHLRWIGLEDARSLELPFITGLVLAEIGALFEEGVFDDWPRRWRDRPAPFFRHDADGSQFEAL